MMIYRLSSADAKLQMKQGTVSLRGLVTEKTGTTRLTLQAHCWNWIRDSMLKLLTFLAILEFYKKC